VYTSENGDKITVDSGSKEMKYIYTMKSNFGIIDIIAYAGGIWFFISQLTLGPLVKFFVSRKLFIADIGEKLFYKMQDSKFELAKA
jgi:hypothetical protein